MEQVKYLGIPFNRTPEEILLQKLNELIVEFNAHVNNNQVHATNTAQTVWCIIDGRNVIGVYTSHSSAITMLQNLPDTARIQVHTLDR